MQKNYDYVIVGGGIVGLTIAKSLCDHGARSIAIFEKEKGLGFHASGRNSGVLHAGIYYATDSLKAKVCSQGARLLYEFAAEQKIPCERKGKVIVATSEEEVSSLEKLWERSLANGISVKKISREELNEIEPEAFSWGSWALFSPDTGVIDSLAVLNALERMLKAKGVDIYYGDPATKINSAEKSLYIDQQTIGYGHLINCAGLQADRIAHQMEVGLQYAILPFKGVYHKLLKSAAERFRGSIYPVPDLRVPFLGVHVTKTVTSDVILGPTAIPALGRENYSSHRGIEGYELPRIAWDLLKMYFKNQDGFRTLVHAEIPKYSRSVFLKTVQRLAPGIKMTDLAPYGKIGLRAQLVNRREKRLEMDFIVEGGPNSTHVLNAISPAFTGSMAFAELVCQRMKENRSL